MNDYFSKEYNDSKRWVSYWHQVKEVLACKPENVLVIGKGNGLVSEYLKLDGIKIITLDINKHLKPDVVASVLTMPLGDDTFDAVLCAQVLEHLSYGEFEKSLREIRRVTKRCAIISLPHFGPVIKFCLKIPLLPSLKFIVKLPYPRKHVFKGEHCWEIGKRGYPMRKIKKDIINSGLIIEKDFIVFENPLHHFFVLKK
ncbi:MAG: class I SAM-dependent methyltransferase [Candidatus Azambacteria bacterium]|nr:class I SAM-dependent methyltransferase [Candidatus Azambacteria bacterium]